MINTTERLIALHKAIIDAERESLERMEGRITSGEMLKRLVTDEWLAWLQPLTALVVQFESGEDAAALVAEVRELLALDGDANPFRTEYARLLQESPDVVLAHASVVRALNSERKTDGLDVQGAARV